MSQTNFEPLHSVAYPQRQPYVRSLSYVDGKGPTPYEFFDQYQSHIGGYSQALLGRSHMVDSDEFTEAWFRAGFFGRMVIDRNTGVTASPAYPPDQVGVHGAGFAFGGVAPWNFRCAGVKVVLDSDFLLTCKLKIVNPATLDDAADRGLFVGVSDFTRAPAPPCFLAGKDAATWRIRSGLETGARGPIYDTGIPCLPGVWYRLQISRVRGAVRWFVNGQIARYDGNEGQWYPYPLLEAQKRIDVSRWRAGAANEGIIVDCCHLLAQRGTP